MNHPATSVLDQWEDWLQRCTDRLLALEGRADANASVDDQRLLDAVFVARKALAARIAELGAARPEDHQALAAQPVRDDLGAPVGDDLAAAAALIQRTLDDVERRLSATEATALAEAEAAAAAETDLHVGAKLAAELGSEVNAVAGLAERLQRRDRLTDVAAKAGMLRARLEGLVAERRQTEERLALLPGELAALQEREQAIRQLAERCAAKICDPPRLAIPAVAALGEPPVLDAGSPWSAQRPRVVLYLERVAKLGRALTEAERRFQAPLNERDELRGLLQAFRDKAAATGRGEHPDLEPVYRAARDQLWSQPCDLGQARQAVQRYVVAVNAAGLEAAP